MLYLLDAASTVSDAAAEAGSQSVWSQILFYGGYILIFGLLFYFMFFRPQRKKKKEEEKLKNSLQIGDEIVTIGGFHGKIVSLKEDSLIIESVLDHTKQKIERWAIQQNLTVHDDAPAK